MPRTLFEKIWGQHAVCPETRAEPAVLYVDLHLLHEVSSPQAFEELEIRGIPVHRPDRCLATLDHSTPTLPVDANGNHAYVSPQAERQVERLRRNCRKHHIELHDWDSPFRGIVHVMGPEMGATHPGMTVVCGDSHTTTHGAFGALAFGIGTTEVSHVLATQCLLQHKPKTMSIEVNGDLHPGVSAKDVILHIIQVIGVNGASGCVIEFRGATIKAMDMESRMTLCNMSIECGAKAGMVAPDTVTFDYLRGRPRSPLGEDWDESLREWRSLCSDEGARFDHCVTFNARDIRPTITYGTNPGMAMSLSSRIPQNDSHPEFSKAMAYMGLNSGRTLLGQKIDVVFIGSCTNARISDLRIVASILRNRQVSPRTQVIIVPGSEAVKKQAEIEGLHHLFTSAGAQWRHSGCSMCIAMNGDMAKSGQYVVSTSNRNFEGRQGGGARTFLASPRTAAVCAVTGRITDPDIFLEEKHG